MENVAGIFQRYEAVRQRLPVASFEGKTRNITSLLDITDEIDAFVFDAFGVLNVGDVPIPGAAARLDQLRALGCAIRILSNAASYNHDRAVEKFRNLGMTVAPDEIVTSRDATLPALAPGIWGCIAAPSDDLSDVPAKTVRLLDDPTDYASVDAFLFLSTEIWTPDRQGFLLKALERQPRPVVIANADLVAPREGGFTLEPGHFGHLLLDEGIPDVRFLGKPFSEVYEMVEASLPGTSTERIAMCGDTLHTDILGAAARGWRSVLVSRDGLFAGEYAPAYCLSSNIRPTWHLSRI
ncbi:HAD-IIA family hydrolase [Roseicyclus marinus]|uniref:Haloacid dehalogenase n=1 Tax=Roseicyclus marinus TaxID=2161673 RepID=A0AA48H4Q3_9RHOB|nr:haloacid dehalogenase [Roseicyclus marinus]